MSIRIIDAGLPGRTRNALLNAGYQTVDQLRSVSDASLRRIPEIGNLGVTIIREIAPYEFQEKPIDVRMSLRDWFAGQALARLADMHHGRAFDPRGTAASAYELADAMLAAREARA